MKGPVGIAVTSVLQFMGALLFLLVGVLCFTGQYFVPKMSKPEIPFGFLCLALAAIGIATAVGVFRLKRWSRYSTLIFAAILVFWGLMQTLVSAVIFFSPPSGRHFTTLDDFAAGLTSAALGGWWLYYFRRKAIRAWFQGKIATGMANSSGCPLSIALLAVLNLVAVPLMLPDAWQAFPIPIFGVVVQGASARLLDMLIIALQLYLGIGLLRLLPAGRLVAIGFYTYEFVNSLLFCVLPGAKGRYDRALAEFLSIWHPQHVAAQSVVNGIAWMDLILSTVFSAIAIYFLITRRAAFEHGAMTGRPPDQTSLASGC